MNLHYFRIDAAELRGPEGKNKMSYEKVVSKFLALLDQVDVLSELSAEDEIDAESHAKILNTLDGEQ